MNDVKHIMLDALKRLENEILNGTNLSPSEIVTINGHEFTFRANMFEMAYAKIIDFRVYASNDEYTTLDFVCYCSKWLGTKDYSQVVQELTKRINLYIKHSETLKKG